MRLTIEQLAFAAEHLQREGEAQAYADSVAPRAAFDPSRDRANGAAYEAFLARRLEALVSLPARFDGLAVGWHRAAVRLFGERAAEALDAVVAEGLVSGWSGKDDAERALMCAMARREKSTERSQ